MSYKRSSRQRFDSCRAAANGQTRGVLQEQLKLRFDLQTPGRRAYQAVEYQWKPAPRSQHSDHWQWEEIVRAYNGVGDQAIAVWAGEELDQLAALAVARLSGSALCWDYLEGHPGGLLRPQRFAILLDAYIRYARLCNLAEIRIEPLNEALAKRYETVYMFRPHPTGRYLKLELR